VLGLEQALIERAMAARGLALGYVWDWGWGFVRHLKSPDHHEIVVVVRESEITKADSLARRLSNGRRVRLVLYPDRVA
jgi:hypothetical protein